MGGTIAIDLGSSNTVVAFQHGDQPPRLLALPPYSLADPVVVPSLLWLSDPDQSRPLVGRQVLEAGLAHDDSPCLQRDFKRHIAAAEARALPGGLIAALEGDHRVAAAEVDGDRAAHARVSDRPVLAVLPCSRRSGAAELR